MFIYFVQTEIGAAFLKDTYLLMISEKKNQTLNAQAEVAHQ